MQDKDILHVMNSLVEKVNGLAILLNTSEYSEENEEEYNEQLNRLLELEEQYPEFISENSPTKRGGGRIHNKIHVRHHPSKINQPLLALDENAVLAYISEVDKAYNDQPDALIYTVPKLRLTYSIQGITIIAQYRDGVLEKAVTIGDGEKGEVISDNARTILNLPHILKNQGMGQPECLRVIGEVTMTKYTLERVNSNLISEGYAPLLDCATAAASAMRQYDSSVTANRNLLFYARDIEEIVPSDMLSDLNTQGQVYEYLEDIGFDTVQSRTNNGVDNLVLTDDIFHVMGDMVKCGTLLIPYEFDGIVISPELLMIKESLASARKSPVVFKFPDISYHTNLLGLEWHMDTYGYIHPWGLIELDGKKQIAKISSIKELQRMGLSESSIVKIIKNKDDVVRIVDAAPDFIDVKYYYPIPELCPSCRNVLITLPNAEIKCINTECPELLMTRLRHFRDQMGLTTISDDMLQHMVNNKIISTPQDLFDPKLGMKLESWGHGYISENHIHTIVKQIDDRRNTTVSKVICALGIECVRETTSKLIARYFPSIKAFMLLETGNLGHIPGLNKAAVNSIRHYLDDAKNQQTLVELDKYLNITDEYALLSNNLYNTSWVILGELENLNGAMQTINMHGGTITKTINGGTTHVLVGKNPPSNKINIAQLNGLPILDINELLAMVG